MKLEVSLEAGLILTEITQVVILAGNGHVFSVRCGVAINGEVVFQQSEVISGKCVTYHTAVHVTSSLRLRGEQFFAHTLTRLYIKNNHGN